jgi:hypothetical protein
VSFTLENSGKVAGAEVAQVYASLPREGLGADEPPKRLVAFEKIELEPVCTSLAHSPLFLSLLSLLSLPPPPSSLCVVLSAYRNEFLHNAHGRVPLPRSPWS